MVTQGEGLPPTKSYSSHGHIMSRDKLKTFISTSTISINTNLGSVVTLGEGLALIKSHVPLIIWSRDATWQNKSVYHFHRTHKHQTWHSGNSGWGATTHNIWRLITWSHDVTLQNWIRRSISSSTRPSTNSFCREKTRGDYLSPSSRAVVWGHMTNYKYCISSSTKLATTNFSIVEV